MLDAELCDSRYDTFRCNRDLTVTGKMIGGGVMLLVRHELGAYQCNE